MPNSQAPSHREPRHQPQWANGKSRGHASACPAGAHPRRPATQTRKAPRMSAQCLARAPHRVRSRCRRRQSRRRRGRRLSTHAATELSPRRRRRHGVRAFGRSQNSCEEEGEKRELAVPAAIAGHSSPPGRHRLGYPRALLSFKRAAGGQLWLRTSCRLRTLARCRWRFPVRFRAIRRRGGGDPTRCCGTRVAVRIWRACQRLG